MLRLSCVAFLALSACGSGLNDNRFPTGSDTLAASSRYDAVYAVNTDEGTVSRVDTETEAVTEIHVGAEPTRIARAGKNLFVTLRGERAVAVLTDDEKPKVVKMIPTGAEPVGVVASENGRRVYVAVSQQGRVLELDGKTFEKLRSWPIADEPKWLALHPSGRGLFVASAFNARLTRIDLRSGETSQIHLPSTERGTGEDSTVDLTPRITGDPAITPDGDTLVVPVIYVDNTTPVETPVDDRPVQNGYASAGLSLGRINPSVVSIPLKSTSKPDPEADPTTIFIGTFADDEIVRSYPSSVTADPDGNRVAVTMEASDVVVVVNLSPFKGQGDDADQRGEERGDFAVSDTGGFRTEGDEDGSSGRVPVTRPSQGGMIDRPVLAIRTASRGPNGVLFVDNDRAFVHDFLGRDIADLNWETADVAVAEFARNGFSRDDRLKGRTPIPTAVSALPEAVDAGRELFYSAIDNKMASGGAGVSCSTCHHDGRNDGLTWNFDLGPRQTPSLAGHVSDTAPVTWSSDVDSVATEAQLTTSLRMGGGGLGSAAASNIQEYVEWSRAVDVQDHETTSPQITRGQALFERSDVGCATCHGGELYTDNASHSVYSEAPMNTPTLVGIAATAPYLHDGSAKTLREVLELSRAGLMGDTSSLSKAEMDDLEAFLRSL